MAASANDLDSSVYRISKQNAEAAHKIAEACVEIIVRRLPGYVIIFLLLGVVQAPSTPTTGLLRVRQRFIVFFIPTRQE